MRPGCRYCGLHEHRSGHEEVGKSLDLSKGPSLRNGMRGRGKRYYCIFTNMFTFVCLCVRVCVCQKSVSGHGVGVGADRNPFIKHPQRSRHCFRHWIKRMNKPD